MRQVHLGQLVAQWALALLLAALPLYGCSLVAHVDRDKIPAEGGSGATGLVGGGAAAGTGGTGLTGGGGGTAGTGGGGGTTCGDNQLDGNETDIDCGGPDCAGCANGKTCQVFSDCSSQFCDVDSCAECTGTADCADAVGTYCYEHACVARKPQGEPCTGVDECASAFCADGYCCNTACDGQCEACNLTALEGVCSPVADADPGDPVCAPYLCDGSSGDCPTSCVGNEDCVAMPDAYCDTADTHSCLGNKDPGETCVNSAECKSTFCVDGVCCGTSACGTATDCDVCNAPGFAGTCHAAAAGESCGNGVCHQCDGTTTDCGESPAGAAGPGCNDATSDTCTAPDTCEAGGVCDHHNVAAGTHTPCGDGECNECDGNGACGNSPNGGQGPGCSGGTVTECDLIDTCLDGTCVPNYVLASDNKPCGGGQCKVCDGTGSCGNSPNNTQGPGCAAGTTSVCDLADTCVDGACVPNYVPKSNHISCGDGICKECDGSGTCGNSQNDAPGPGCTTAATSECDLADTCLNGTCMPNHIPASDHLPCGDGECKECDGTGVCGNSQNGTQGPGCAGGTVTECDLIDTCLDGTCIPNYVQASANKPCGDGECKVCDGTGSCGNSPNNTQGPGCSAGTVTDCDLADICIDGTCVPNYVPASDHTPCGDGICKECDGTGSCGNSANNTQGPGCAAGTVTECDLADTCVDGACLPNLVPASDHKPCLDGVCNECDGNGACVASPLGQPGPGCGDATNNTCTAPDTCAAGGVCDAHNAAAGLACNDNEGTRCNAVGQCLPTFMVLRIGDGSGTLNNAAWPVFVEERYVADGSLVAKAGNPIAMPTAVNGLNGRLTLAGTSDAEGCLSLSENGAYVTLGGYDADVGTAGVLGTTAAAVNRIVGRIDASYNVDTTTHLLAFSTGSIRGATSADGSAFWATGAGSTAGVRYAPLGALTGTPTLQLLNLPTNERAIHIFGGQLYADASIGEGTGYYTVFTVGSGEPTTAGQAATLLNGLPNAATQSPYSFALVDFDSGVAGLDTLYIADDRALANGGGILKYTFNGTTWSAATFNITGNVPVRGLTARVTGTTVTLLATAAATNANSVLRVIDDGSGSATATAIYATPAKTVLRGIAFAPH